MKKLIELNERLSGIYAELYSIKKDMETFYEDEIRVKNEKGKFVTYAGGGEIYFPTLEYERNGKVFREMVKVESPNKSRVYDLAKSKIDEKYDQKIKHIGLGSYGENIESLDDEITHNEKVVRLDLIAREITEIQQNIENEIK